MSTYYRYTIHHLFSVKFWSTPDNIQRLNFALLHRRPAQILEVKASDEHQREGTVHFPIISTQRAVISAQVGAIKNKRKNLKCRGAIKLRARRFFFLASPWLHNGEVCITKCFLIKANWLFFRDNCQVGLQGLQTGCRCFLQDMPSLLHRRSWHLQDVCGGCGI